MKTKFFFFIVSFTALLITCKEEINIISENRAFIGGEIINPNSNLIVLKKSGVLIDTVKLRKNNRFSYTFKGFEPGLYEFDDGKEYQKILIEPNDSLMLRLNTLDFDASLVYTGIGAKQNNFLMEMYLLNKEEDSKVLGLGQKTAQEFDSIYSKLKKQKLKRLKAFRKKNKTSDLFDEIAEASINYEYYAHKELYPLVNYKISELDAFESLPDDFYNYRKYIDYNNNTLKDFSPYLTFLSFHFNNLALRDHFKHSKDSLYNKLDVHYNLDKLELISKKINNKDIKNHLLKNVLKQFISVSKNTLDYDAMLKSFITKSTNKEDLASAKNLVESYKRLKSGEKIPSVILTNATETEIKITDLITKPTIIYFWTAKNKNHFVSAHKRAKSLHVKYPEFEFIAVNVDKTSSQKQLNILKRYNLKANNEYQFKHPRQAKKALSVYPILKTFIVEENGKIVNAKANMFNIGFEQELIGFLNR